MPSDTGVMTRDYSLDKGSFKKQPPFGWRVELAHELAPFCDSDRYNKSTLILLESGRELGPAHTLHDDIRRYGGGRFSFWKDTLYFSTGDGSDPNTNPHTYIVRRVAVDAHPGRLEWLVEPPGDPGLTDDQHEAVKLIEAEARRRLRNIGHDSLGEDNYYRLRLDSGLILAGHEVATIAFLRARRARWRRIWDIGAGIGQIGAMLALDGFEVIAAERDAKTRAGLEAIFDAVARGFPETRNRLFVTGTAFPQAVAGHDVSTDAAVVMGHTSTDSERNYEVFCRVLGSFNAGIVEFRTLLTRLMREGEEARRADDYCGRFGWTAVPIVRYPPVLRPGLWNLHFVEMQPRGSRRAGAAVS